MLEYFLLASVKGFATKTTKSKSGTRFGVPKTVKEYEVDKSPETLELIKFLHSNPSMKTDMENIEVGIDPVTGRRGLYATKNFSKDKIICKIPSDFALALSDPVKGGEDAPTIADGGANYIQMYCKDSQTQAQWSPYLDTLPTEVGEAATPDFLAKKKLTCLNFLDS